MRLKLINIAVSCLLLMQAVEAQAPHEQIANRLREYCGRVQWQEAYVHTDRDTYIAGEDMWLKVYCIDRQSGLPAPDAIAYLELLGSDNRPIIRKRIRLVKGAGPDQIVLPDTLSSGVYRLRAYTNAMKNFMPDNCFMRDVYVFNAFNQKAIIVPGRQAESRHNYKLALETANREDSLVIRIAGSQPAIGEGYTILIHTRGNINYSAPVKSGHNPAGIAVPKRILDPGINHITLFNELQEPVAERFVYTTVKPAPVDANIPGQAARREKMSLILPGIESSSVSVSVVPSAPGMPDISDYMIFGSEFGPGLYEKTRGVSREELTTAFVDSILQGAESSWIDWQKILHGKPETSGFNRETDEHSFSGTLISDNPAGKFIIMSIPGKKAYFQYTLTDSAGNFTFSLPADGEQRDLVIQPDEVNERSSIKLTSSFYELYEKQDETGAARSVPFPGQWSEAYQVSKIYGIRHAKPSTGPVMQSAPVRRFYGIPDVELKLADYIKLPLMEEIFFEIIPGANLRKRRTGYEIRISDPLTKEVYDDPPSLFVDGVRINDAGTIAEIDPDLVEQIDVVLDKYVVGDYMFHGIVNVTSKKADLSIIEVPRSAVRTRYRVFEPVNIFTSPSYPDEKTRNSRIPDFRNTLYWNPVPETGKPVEFWTSDIPGEYVVNIQGITPDGKLISLKKTFIVR